MSSLVISISGCTKLGGDPGAYNLGEAEINLPPLTIEPQKVQVIQGNTRRFSGQGGFVGTVGYRYSVESLDGSANGGTIDPITGIYTAPAVVNANNALSFVIVTDARGVTASTTVYNITPLVITPTSQVVTIGKKANFDVIGGAAPYTWCVVDTITGLCLPTANVGSITTTGMFEASLATSGNTVVKAIDASGNSAEAAISVQPIPQLYPSGESFPYGWTLQMLTIGGSPPFKYTLDSNSAAAGGTIDSSGILTIPDLTGITSVTVTDNYTYSVTSNLYVINPNKIATGPNTTCALFPDTKGIKCWGDNTNGQTGYPSSFVKDGIIGTNDFLGDQPNEVGARVGLHQLSGGTYINSEQVVMGFDFSCALDSAFNIRCWGKNSYGQFGTTTPAVGGTLANASAASGGASPSKYTSTANISASRIGAGLYHTCAVDRNTAGEGRLYCWGRNDGGQLGIGSTTNTVQPILNTHKLDFPSKVLDIKAGAKHTCVLLEGSATFNSNTNQIRCWGDNSVGQLGLNATQVTQFTGSLFGDAPAEVTNLTSVAGLPVIFTTPGTALPTGATLMPIALSSGENHVCALLNDQTVRCWGDNGSGQLGRGVSDAFLGTPATVGASLGTERPLKVIAGYNKTCVIFLGGIIKCFGANNSCSLGIGDAVTTTIGKIPTELGLNLKSTNVAVGAFVVDAAVGQSHVCALLNDNRVKCWGRGVTGQLGNNSSNTLGCDNLDMGDFLPAVGIF